MNEPIDELRIQRLVDGAMTDEDRRKFLDSLDQQPESWRELALAFVEEQIWRREIGKEQPGLAASEKPGAEPARPARRPSWGVLVAVAACILLLPCLGFYLGQVSQRASLGALSDNQREIADNTEEPRQAVRQPVFSQEQIDGYAQPMQAGVRTTANDRLASLGYRLDSRTQYLSGQLDDGRRLVVPVRTMMVNYYGQ